MASKKTKIVCAALCVLFFAMMVVMTVLPEDKAPVETKEEAVDCFVGAPVITVSGSIRQTRYCPILTMRFYNHDTEPVSAVKVLIRSYNVYDEEIWRSAPCRVIYQEHRIQPGEEATACYTLPDNTKRAEIYLYSIYYPDGIKPEWGDREATTEQIDLYAPKTVIKYEY